MQIIVIKTQSQMKQECIVQWNAHPSINKKRCELIFLYNLY
jgi:hypothetical protein